MKTVFPDDIVLYSILPRLPAKTLVRFMCVCKSWKSFIHHPSFLHFRKLIFSQNNHTHHRLLFLQPDPHASAIATSQPHLFSTPLNPNNTITSSPPRATLLFTLPNLNFSQTSVQHVNGLLCFHPRNDIWLSSSSSRVNAFTLIANPTTRQFLTLPPDHSLVTETKFLVSTYFGYDPARDEFKVLRLVQCHGSHEFRIFTLGSDTSWRLLPAVEKPFFLMRCLLSHPKRCLCVNGAIHWTYSSFGSVIDSDLSVVAFDLGTEQFRVMRSPSRYLYRETSIGLLWYPDLVEIDGCLCLVGYNEFGLRLWILRDQIWEEEKSVVIPVSQSQKVFFPLCRVPTTGEILLLPYFLPRRVKGVYYDMERMSSRCVVVMEMPQPLWPDNRSGEVDIFLCEESFRLLG